MHPFCWAISGQRGRPAAGSSFPDPGVLPWVPDSEETAAQREPVGGQDLDTPTAEQLFVKECILVSCSITNYHKLGVLKQQKFILLQGARGPNSRFWQGG